MMFYLLGVALCCAVLFLLVSLGTLVSTALSRMASARLRRVHRNRLPGVLFLIHLAPFLIAFAVVVGFVLPAFVALEPSSTGEGLNPWLALAAVLGAGILLGISGRLLKTLIATSRQQNQWLREAQPLHGDNRSVFVLPATEPVMAVTGLLEPKIFVSRSIVSSLSEEELAAALSHEFAHVQARDNVKQLLLRITQLPGRFGVSSRLKTWICATEILADRTAIAGGTSAYDLASALVKVARLSAGARPLPAMVASHLVPDCAGSAVASRVLQLREILDEPAPTSTSPVLKTNAIAMKWLVVAGAIAVYLLSLNSLLPHIHEALEWLVR
jgi:Zn-dependent protease with chaperone function